MDFKNYAKQVQAADVNKLAYVGSKPGQHKLDSDWQTPDYIISAARNVMGSIDLDPFSSAEANARIKAKVFYSKEDDAIECDWSETKSETAFINPPNVRGMMNKAVDKIIEQYQAGAFKQCVLVVNNATDTGWFHKLIVIADVMCFTEGRIAFLSPAEDGVLKQVSNNTRGQTLFYIGDRVKEFLTVYKDLGWCLEINKKGNNTGQKIPIVDSPRQIPGEDVQSSKAKALIAKRRVPPPPVRGVKFQCLHLLNKGRVR